MCDCRSRGVCCGPQSRRKLPNVNRSKGRLIRLKKPCEMARHGKGHKKKLVSGPIISQNAALKNKFYTEFAHFQVWYLSEHLRQNPAQSIDLSSLQQLAVSHSRPQSTTELRFYLHSSVIAGKNVAVIL